MNPDELFREEIPRIAASARSASPRWTATATSTVSYRSSWTYLMTPAGSLPISFEIEASTIGEAAGKFGDLAAEAVQDAVRQLQEMRREAASSLIVQARAACPVAEYREVAIGRRHSRRASAPLKPHCLEIPRRGHHNANTILWSPDGSPSPFCLKNTVVFPRLAVPLAVGRPASIAAVELRRDSDARLLCLAQRGECEHPGHDDLYGVGTVVVIRRVDAVMVACRCLCRARSAPSCRRFAMAKSTWKQTWKSCRCPGAAVPPSMR